MSFGDTLLGISWPWQVEMTEKGYINDNFKLWTLLLECCEGYGHELMIYLERYFNYLHNDVCHLVTHFLV